MIRTLFTDVGGVLLTNGWDSDTRERAAAQFHLDLREMNNRHHLTFDTYEIGKLKLEDYLARVVFYEPRNFTLQQFLDFVFAQSQALPDMRELLAGLKARHHLKVAVISNEGRELTEYRIRKFGLADFVDFFVSSCFVRFRKPDSDIFRMAIDLAQTPPDESVYIDDRQLFVEVAATCGMRSILHRDYPGTRAQLAALGLD
jgi:putative hydrolase of the HAD superfamily